VGEDNGGGESGSGRAAKGGEQQRVLVR